jgi:hypothetical protein|tara:strand:- start:715 stop:969 length:255 start_codon:yes stop_codon:yes gene_type:complete
MRHLKDFKGFKINENTEPDIDKIEELLENGESSNIHSIAKDILGDAYDNMSDSEIIVLLLDKFKEQSTTISEFMRLWNNYIGVE